MNFKSWMENFEQWDGWWIHYSHGVPRSPDKGAERVPLMKIHYNMMWNDPLGIYFFPEKFEKKTKGGWHNYDFKYIVEFPSSMKVFDLSKFTDDEFDEILKKYNIAPEAKDAYKSLNLKPSDRFWTSLEHHFAARQGQNESGRKAKMNRLFRDMGYDAIFDDTDAIHT